MKDKQKILFIFGPGRKTKLDENSFKAKEFFYGFHYFTKSYKTEIIEVFKGSENKKGIRKLLHFFDRVIVKLTNFRSSTIELITINNIRRYKLFDSTIFTSDALFLSFLPIALIYKILRRKNKNYIITMGLFGKKSSNILESIFSSLYIRLILIGGDKFIFLGYGEYQFALSKFPKQLKKFEYLPFCVDTGFWSKTDNKEKEYEILFVGNDGKRDFELLKKIIQENSKLNFIVITNHDLKIDFENVEIVKGNWSEQLISDEKLREYYSKSRLTIIPLKNSYQPSGQSVGLQSLACKTPILISETDGFWDTKKFINDFEINFVSSEDSNVWSDRINHILSDKKNMEISNTQSKLFNKQYDIEIFNLGLEKIILSND